jgi:uncharacterized protein
MGLRIRVTVRPQARRETLADLGSRGYWVAVRASPRDGKANEELIGLLARHFAVSKTKIKIVRGQFSMNKLVEIG